MSSELQGYYDNFATQPSRWADTDASRCGCHGSGYFVSEVDTVHQCPIHYTPGQQHPEDDTPPDEYALSGLIRFFSRMRKVEPQPAIPDDSDDIPF